MSTFDEWIERVEFANPGDVGLFPVRIDYLCDLVDAVERCRCDETEPRPVAEVRSRLRVVQYALIALTMPLQPDHFAQVLCGVIAERLLVEMEADHAE